MHADPIIRADPAALREELVRRWTRLGAEPDNPDRYELDEFGELIVSPRPTTAHQRVDERSPGLLRRIWYGGGSRSRCIRIAASGYPDVVWMAPERWALCNDQTPLQTVPDVCVEVVSPSNTREEILMKVGAYLRGGAREAIVVGLKGDVEFFGPGGKLEASALGIRLELPADLFWSPRLGSRPSADTARAGAEEEAISSCGQSAKKLIA